MMPVMQPLEQVVPQPKRGWLKRPALRDAVLCLSLANLCFLRVWEETLAYRKSDMFLMKEIPSQLDYLATAS